MIIVGTQAERFKAWHSTQGVTRFNGAYYYAQEIDNIILPKIDLNLFIVTVGATLLLPYQVPNGAVIICHDNRTTRRSYGHLFSKKILWVCSKQSTVDALKSYGEKAVYIPLSIDFDYVKKFKSKKTEDAAFVGNPWGFKKDYLSSLPKDVKQLNGMARDTLLTEMSKYKRVIAEGRCLMEAQVLGCKAEVPQYDSIEAVYVKAMDSLDALPYWQEALSTHHYDQTQRCIIITMRTFNDLVAGHRRRVGEVFAVSDARASQLLDYKPTIVEQL